MSTHKIIKELLDENLIGAKKEIEDILYEKLGEHLNEMYMEIAPSIIGESKKKMDPVGEEDEDVNNDGKVNTGDDVIMSRRKKISKAIAKRKKTNEEANPAVLAPHAAPTDEPGDISKKKNKKEKSSKLAASSVNSGTGAY